MNIDTRQLAADGLSLGIVLTSDKYEALAVVLGGIYVARINHKYWPLTHFITD